MVHTKEEIIERLKEHRGDMKQAKILAELNACDIRVIKLIAEEAGIRLGKMGTYFTVSEEKALQRMLKAGLPIAYIERRLHIHHNKICEYAINHKLRERKTDTFRPSIPFVGYSIVEAKK